MKPTITFGADPEFFVRERATGTIIPACGLFGGDKGAPILLSGDGGYLEDGVTIELNVAPKSDVSALRQGLLGLKALWEQRFPQHELVCQPSAAFTKATLRKHPQAMAIGCSADLCAWGIRRAPQVSDFGPRRFAGGHIHVGLDPWPEGLAKDFVIKWLDVFALFPDLSNSSPDRYAHYGRPGLYRTTHYGVEWRSPDPSWVSMGANVALYAEKAINCLVNEGLKDIENTTTRFSTFIDGDAVPVLLAKPHLEITERLPIRPYKNTAEYMQWVVHK